MMTRGTESLVAAAEQAGIRRFVLMSALGTSEATRELTPYFRAKWAMEQTVQAAPFEHTIFRPSFVFGRDGGVLPTFLRLVRYSPVTPVVGPGTQRIQPIWVDDVAAYFAKSIDLVGAAGRTFEIGGPDVVTWDGLYSRIASHPRQAAGEAAPALRPHAGAGAGDRGATGAEPDHAGPGEDARGRRQRGHERRRATDVRARRSSRSTSSCGAPREDRRARRRAWAYEDGRKLAELARDVAGKEQPRVCFVPTAVGDASEPVVRFYEIWRGLRRALAPEVLPLAAAKTCASSPSRRT